MKDDERRVGLVALDEILDLVDDERVELDDVRRELDERGSTSCRSARAGSRRELDDTERKTDAAAGFAGSL